MTGVRINSMALVYSDNQSVLANTTGTDLALKQKSNSIALNSVQEEKVRDEWRTTYIESDENTSDLLAKCIPSGEKRQSLVAECYIIFILRLQRCLVTKVDVGELMEQSYLNYMFLMFIFIWTLFYIES